MAPNSLPKNWPPTTPYLIVPTYSRTLTSSHLSAIRAPPPPTALHEIPTITHRPGPSPLVKILPITTPDHPACGQYGLFAARDLPPGTFILQYIGVIHGPPEEGKEDEHADSDYDLSLNREMGIGTDAAKGGNEARFVNDYRGVREEGANAEFKEVWNGKERGMAVWVLPEGKKGKRKGIKKGEEILVSYGRGFWGARRDEDGKGEDN